MKIVTIENLDYPESRLAYVQIINTIASNHSRSDLREGMNRLKKDTDARNFFDWGLDVTISGFIKEWVIKFPKFLPTEYKNQINMEEERIYRRNRIFIQGNF